MNQETPNVKKVLKHEMWHCFTPLALRVTSSAMRLMIAKMFDGMQMFLQCSTLAKKQIIKIAAG